MGACDVCLGIALYKLCAAVSKPVFLALVSLAILQFFALDHWLGWADQREQAWMAEHCPDGVYPPLPTCADGRTLLSSIIADAHGRHRCLRYDCKKTRT